MTAMTTTSTTSTNYKASGSKSKCTAQTQRAQTKTIQQDSSQIFKTKAPLEYATMTCSEKCRDLFVTHSVMPRLSLAFLLNSIQRQSQNQRQWQQEEWNQCHCDALFCTNDNDNDNPTTTTTTNNASNTSNASTGNQQESSCQWSPFSIQCLLKILDNNDIINMCHANHPHAQSFYPAPQWRHYQLADLFKGIPATWNNASLMPNNSLAQAYYYPAMAAPTPIPGDKDKRRIMKNNYTLLYQLVQERIPINATTASYSYRNNTTSSSNPLQLPVPPSQQVLVQPNPNTLVVHVRLGDVVDAAVDSVQELLLTPPKYFYRAKNNMSGMCCDEPWIHPDYLALPRKWNQYVKPLVYYEQVLRDVLLVSKQQQQQQQQQLEMFAEIVIMGAAHQGQAKQNNATKSCMYTHVLQAWLQMVLKHIPVRLRLGNNPDDDLIYAAQAKAYIPSGGGYSEMIQKLHDMFHP